MASLFAFITQFFAMRSIRVIILLLLATSMFATLGWQAWLFTNTLHEQAPTSPQETHAASTDSTQNTPSHNLSSLFGAKNQDTKLNAQSLEKLPESNLDLQVSAIFFMVRPEQSSVILEDGDRTLILKPGEEARPGIVVQKIESHRVTLKRNGKLEQISFKGFGEFPGGATMLTGNAAKEPKRNNHALYKNAKNNSYLPQSNPAQATEANRPNGIASSVVNGEEPALLADEKNAPTAYQKYIQQKIARTN